MRAFRKIDTFLSLHAPRVYSTVIWSFIGLMKPTAHRYGLLMYKRLKLSILLLSALSLAACAVTPNAAAEAGFNAPENVPTPSLKTNTPTEQRERQVRFDLWKTEFIQRAIAKGYEPRLVKTMISPAKINPLALQRDKSQPEFTSPVWTYVDKARSPSRVKNGQSKLNKHASLLNQIEQRYRVDSSVLTAIWGLETSYGRILGDYNLVSALATFAFEGRRVKFGEEQLFATLDIVQSGAVRPAQLKSSWAGAMGMTQFIPTTIRDYAVDFDNDGNKDLWTNPADALGSAAHYLSRFGWRIEEPIYTEVKLPANFDYNLSDGRKLSINDWTAKGVAPINGKRWSADAGFLEAKLLVLAGSKGPKLLTFKNFDVIKRYNNSTSYALGIASLSQAYSGGGTFVQDWPRDDKMVRHSDLMRLQKKLTALGYDTQGADGIIGPNSRRAIRAWQTANRLTADGYIEQSLFNKIMAAQ